MFQLDNDLKHSMMKTTEFLKKCNVKVLNWPRISLDLNPIKHFWNAHEQKLEKRLKDCMPFMCTKHSSVCANLIWSMPLRLQAVVKNGARYLFQITFITGVYLFWGCYIIHIFSYRVTMI